MKRVVVTFLGAAALFLGCESATGDVAPRFCEPASCGDHGTCAEGAAGPVCVCASGFASSNGSACLAIPDPCSGVDCGAGGVCVVGSSGPACLCSAGFVPKAGACAPTVEGSDPCAEASCGAHGLCAVAGASPICVCDAGYVSDGGTCVAGPDPCEGVDCEGHGLCAVAAGDQPVCVCEAGYASAGATCAALPVPGAACAGVACSTHGTCVIAGDGAALCVCDPGFYRAGEACLANVDPCSADTCGAGGACVVTATGPACLCGPGYVADGAACVAQAGDPCAGVACSGFGACVAGSGGPVCVCDAGFSAQGTDCVADADPCLGVDCSGQGGCFLAGGAATCACDTGFKAAGLACLPAPEDAIPETVATDLSTAIPHPVVGAEYIPNEFLVHAIVGHDAAALSALIASVGATVAAYKPSSRRYIVRFPANTTFEVVSTAVASLKTSPDVGSIIEQWLVADAAVPPGGWNEASPGGDNWFLEAIRAPSAWAFSVGVGVRVGVIDQGRPNHADLTSALAEQTLGYALAPGDYASSKDHGGAVSGLISAGGGNDRGLPGVAFGADLYYCEHNTTLDSIFNCFEWLLDRDVRVINMSFGFAFRDGCYDCDFADGVAPWNSPEKKAVRDAWVTWWETELSKRMAKPWVLVTAAGNEALPDTTFAAPMAGIARKPGGVRERVLVVGATGTDSDALECYSNRGSLDIAAPGGDYWACDSIFSHDEMWALSGTSGMKEGHGTSYASPLVAGVTALVWAVQPDWAPATVVQAVVDGGAPGPPGLPFLDAGDAVAVAVQACTAGNGTVNAAAGACTFGCVAACKGKSCGASDGCGGTCTGAEVQWCNGDTLVSCGSDGAESSVDCTKFGRTCLPDPKNGVYHCIYVDSDALPSGEIVAPAPWSTVAGPLTIQIQASDDKLLAKVTVLVSGPTGQVYSHTEQPGEASLEVALGPIDTSTWAPGDYWIALWLDDGAHSPLEADVSAIHFGGPCGETCPNMVRLPAVGATTTFQMGSEGEWGQSSNETPPHEVTLPAYLIDRYEVSVAEYAICVDSQACATPKSGGGCNWGVAANEDHPVNCMDWYGANTYCQWAGKRLCTEAEWERAAAGEEDRLFPWGDACPGSWDTSCEAGEFGPATARANCSESDCNDGFTGTAPVGSFPSGVSPDGVFDLAGNVWEWVQDCWHSSYTGAPTDGSAWTASCSSSSRVYRGGSFDFGAALLRAGYRFAGVPGYAFDVLGFRCCRSTP